MCTQCQTMMPIAVTPINPAYNPAYLKAIGMANNPYPSIPLIICIAASRLLVKEIIEARCFCKDVLQPSLEGALAYEVDMVRCR